MPRIQSMSRLRFISLRSYHRSAFRAHFGAVAFCLRMPYLPLQFSEDKFRALVEQSIVGCYLVREGGYVYVNPKFEQIFGYAPGEVIDKGVSVDDTIWPADRPKVREYLRRRLAGEMPNLHYECRGRHKDGTPIELEVHGSRTDFDGEPAVMGVVLDITDRRRAERAMRENEERYALAALGSNDGLWDWDLRRGRVYFSPRWKAQLGATESEIGDKPDEWFGRVHPDDRERLRAALAAHLQGFAPHLEIEHRMRHMDGRWCWMLVRGAAVRDEAGVAVRVAGSQTDVTARKQSEEKLSHDSLHDALTGLPNRSLFFDRLRQSMAFLQRRQDYRFGVLYLDVDRFKTVNDSLGHTQGDRLLVEVAGRLLGCVSPGDTVARLGGDEFAVLLEDMPDNDEPVRAAIRIHDALAAPHELADTEVFASASVGVAVGSAQYQSPEDVLRDAETAMYRAKEMGPAQHAVFDPSMHADVRARLQLESDLRRAIERGELRLNYQPIVSLESGEVTGCEALVVWDHPTRGVLPPGDFIPMAEETGLIIPLGRWALLQACRECRSWNEALRGPDVSVSVNLSSIQIGTPQLLEDVRAALLLSGLAAHLLKLEVTESIVLQTGNSAPLLNQIRALGVHLLLDDFGTGYSSLSYLHNFRFDTLKIDRSFVSQLELGGRHAEIVRTIVSLARALSLDVVAEGVENPTQQKLLHQLGVESAQGYWFSRALPADAFRSLLLSRKPFSLAV
jgi:diguanylate cyclase (GGDEF)-like protein/PAS domain S-box-containing protein